MTRPYLSKKLVDNVYKRYDNPNGQGKCWHCGKKLIFKNRSSHKSRGAWQIDHYPVQYKDIEDQCCLGITNSNDETNLVPSCLECNVSHKYEKNKCYYCNKSQFPCKKSFFYKIAVMLLIIYSLLLTYLYLTCKV